MANLVGALPSEVAVMGTLTNNIHNLFASFYKPDKSGKGRHRIIIEGKAFPSDHVWHQSLVKSRSCEEARLLTEKTVRYRITNPMART